MGSWTRVGAPLGAFLLLAFFPQDSALTQASGATSYSIPPGDLMPALKAFLRQTGGEVNFPVEKIQGKKTSGVRGQLQAPEALKRLLEGTGLSFLQDGTGAYFVVPSVDVKNPGGQCTRDRAVPSICRER